MERYIATFFSHFGAIRFNKHLKSVGLSGTLMPVPRKVSSSCGTCVQFETDDLTLPPMQDVEGIYRQMGEEFHSIQSNL